MADDQHDAAAWREADLRHVLHNGTNLLDHLEHGPLIFVRGQGVRLWGRRRARISRRHLRPSELQPRLRRAGADPSGRRPARATVFRSQHRGDGQSALRHAGAAHRRPASRRPLPRLHDDDRLGRERSRLQAGPLGQSSRRTTGEAQDHQPTPELPRQYAGHHGRDRDVRAVVGRRAAAAGLSARRATVLLSVPLGCRPSQRPLLPARRRGPRSAHRARGAGYRRRHSRRAGATSSRRARSAAGVFPRPCAASATATTSC